MKRPLRFFVVVVVAWAALPFAAGAPVEAAQAAASGGDSDLPGSGAPAHGISPAFAAQGDNLVRLQIGAFDPLTDALPTQPGIDMVDENMLAPGVAQHWIVQARDQRFADVMHAVESAGGLALGSLPQTAYVVKATPEQRAAIAADPSVRWSAYLQPAWRVPAAGNGYQGLLEIGGANLYEVDSSRQDPDAGSTAAALSTMPGVEVVEDAGPVVIVRATAAEVPAIASIPTVEWVTLKPTFMPLNANARWVIDTGERDIYGATKPGGLTGAGQTAAVADTAVNYKPDKLGTAHVAFRDCPGDDLSACKEADYTQRRAGSSTVKITDTISNNPPGTHDRRHDRGRYYWHIRWRLSRARKKAHGEGRNAEASGVSERCPPPRSHGHKRG